MLSFLKYALLALLIILVLLVIYGLIEPYLLDEETLEVPIPNLPQTWEGREIAVVGDFQLGMWLSNDETVRQAIAVIVERDPAVVLILGDFVYHAANDRDNEVKRAAQVVTPLVEAGIPTFAVLGNHDYSAVDRDDQTMNQVLASRLRTSLEGVGVTVIENEAVAFGEGENKLYLVGIGSYIANQAKPEEALAQVPPHAARVVFMHHPETFEHLPAQTAPLAVAGHTHGGQIAIPGFPNWSWVKYFSQDVEEAHVDGWIKDYGQPGNRLYVNRGIGMSLIPIRIGAPPELTIFTLRR